MENRLIYRMMKIEKNFSSMTDIEIFPMNTMNKSRIKRDQKKTWKNSFLLREINEIEIIR